jgi:hypothetical protein
MSSRLSEGGNRSRRDPGWQVQAQFLHVEARGARVLLWCPSVYGDGVVGLGSPGSKQGRGVFWMMRWSSAVQRGSRKGEGLVDGNLHLPDGDLPEAPSAPVMDLPWLQGGEDEQERESGEGKNEQQGTVREEGLGLYTIGVSSVHGAFRRK